ncbi:MAG: hypothetical protein REH79_02410 [Spiroplasma sp.]|nr:hypothetical protein [Spiroplasma sp.]
MFFSKIWLNFIILISIILPCSSNFLVNTNKKINYQTNSLNANRPHFYDRLDTIIIFKQNVEKKLNLLNYFWDQELYYQVMITINYLSESWKSFSSLNAWCRDFSWLWEDNLLLKQRCADLKSIDQQINFWKQKLINSDQKNDLLLDSFMIFKDKADFLDNFINYQINNITGLDWNNEANFKNLQQITEEYNLLNREVLEWELGSQYQNYLYSLDKYQKFYQLYNLITVKIKNNFHYLIKLIIESINQEIKNLIIAVKKIANQGNNTHQYFLIFEKWKLIRQYQDYLVDEDLQENLSSQFAEFNYLANQLEFLFQKDYQFLIVTFYHNLEKLQNNLIKRTEKITLFGIWEEIINLHQIFKQYQSDYQIIKNQQNKYLNLLKNQFNFEKIIKNIAEIFANLHYQGINSVTNDPDDDSLLIKYMTDEAFSKMVNNYMSEKNIIALVSIILSSTVITTSLSALGAAAGPIGAIIGAITGAILSYMVSDLINKTIDLIYGEWSQLLIDFKNISRGAGVIFKIPKKNYPPNRIISIINSTIRPQAPKFLN